LLVPGKPLLRSVALLLHVPSKVTDPKLPKPKTAQEMRLFPDDTTTLVKTAAESPPPRYMRVQPM
jgi:hypothetical protein